MSDFAKLFARIPDDVVLSVSSRDLNLGQAQTCLCGWAVRESIARAVNKSAERVHPDYVITACEEQFGGEWDDVFWMVVDPEVAPEIETAWVDRLDKAVEQAR